MSPCAHGSQSHVSSLSCVSSLFYTACCHTYKKFTHTVDSSGETEIPRDTTAASWTSRPASHRLEAARPPTNLPPTSLLRGYRPQRVVVAPPRHATRPLPRRETFQCTTLPQVVLVDISYACMQASPDLAYGARVLSTARLEENRRNN